MIAKHILLVVLVCIIIILIINININININIPNRESFTAKPKKIGLCFLIYDKINHEELWYNWLKNVDKSKYNIYIHYKENKPMKYFEQYKLENCIPTKYADVSLIHAHNILFSAALNDNCYKIVSLSQACIPLKSFYYVYDFLTKDNMGHFNVAKPDTCFPRCNNLLNYYNKANIQKSSNWFILNKEHCEIVTSVDTDTIDKKYKFTSPEEHYFITTIYDSNQQHNLIETANLSADATTFTGWNDMTNYKSFKDSKITGAPNNYKYICSEELTYLIQSKSLFGRKFLENCGGLERLLEQL